MAKRVTTAEFIARAKAGHGDRYSLTMSTNKAAEAILIVIERIAKWAMRERRILGLGFPLAAIALVACGQPPPENDDEDMSISSADEAFIGGDQDLRFDAYDCTQDCSGHDAGYAWAENKGITDPGDCGGNSQSFIEGCMQYASEQ